MITQHWVNGPDKIEARNEQGGKPMHLSRSLLDLRSKIFIKDLGLSRSLIHVVARVEDLASLMYRLKQVRYETLVVLVQGLSIL